MEPAVCIKALASIYHMAAWQFSYAAARNALRLPAKGCRVKGELRPHVQRRRLRPRVRSHRPAKNGRHCGIISLRRGASPGAVSVVFSGGRGTRSIMCP
jgi:hypothetical protein